MPLAFVRVLLASLYQWLRFERLEGSLGRLVEFGDRHWESLAHVVDVLIPDSFWVVRHCGNAQVIEKVHLLAKSLPLVDLPRSLHLPESGDQIFSLLRPLVLGQVPRPADVPPYCHGLVLLERVHPHTANRVVRALGFDVQLGPNRVKIVNTWTRLTSEAADSSSCSGLRATAPG